MRYVLAGQSECRVEDPSHQKAVKRCFMTEKLKTIWKSFQLWWLAVATQIAVVLVAEVGAATSDEEDDDD